VKSLKKYIRPILIAVQAVSVVGTVVSILTKKKTSAGIFAATGIFAAIAAVLVYKKEQAEKKAEEKWNAENAFDETFDDGVSTILEEDIPSAVEAKLAVDSKEEKCPSANLSQAIKNLEEAGDALKEVLEGLENEFGDGSDSLKEM
jgi:hypothetical protein